MVLKRIEGESLKEFKLRICGNKDLPEYDLSWKRVAEIINEETGNKFDESTYRKWYQAYIEGYEDGVAENITGEEIIQELEEKERKFLKSKVQASDQRREYLKLIRDEARNDYNREFIYKCAEEIAKSKPLKFTRHNLDRVCGKETVLMLSDWHYGLFTSNYWNNFDVDTFEYRIDKLVRKTIEHSILHKSRKLHIFLLGDLIHGIIHTTARIASQEDVIQQTMKVCEVLAEMIAQFAPHFDEIKIYNAIGNHERVTPNKSESITSENFANFIPWYLQARLKHMDFVKIVNNNIDDEIVVAEVCGYTIFGVHGNRDKISNVVQNLTLMTKRFAQYVFLGHYHHIEENEIHGIEVVANGTLSGVDDFAKELRLTNKASQRVMIFNKEDGRESTYNISL